MTGALDPRLDILPSAQRAIWPSLREVTKLGFTLYGGTAVALQLGHRASIDFDFFTTRTVDPILLANSLPILLREATTLQAEPNTLTVAAVVSDQSQGVKLSFFGGLPWAEPARSRETRDGVLRIASLEDLLATKLVVLQKRVEVKDYQDIAAILCAGVPLTTGLARAREIYGTTFQPSESLKAMVYFQEGDFTALSMTDRSSLIAAARSVETID